MDTKLTVNQAARKLNLSSKNVRRWLKSGKLNGEKVDGKWYVQVDSTFEHYLNPNVQMDTQLALEHLQDETRHLRELLANRDNQIEAMNQHIERLSQLLAVSHRSIQQVTDQVQLLIEDNRKPSFWKRLFGR
ncbi:helix-turn-helix domain-containing protein [Candidatus Poribacteria bacterium]|nr:helix-turn-helix domain-containing protein [Candidatus Poribacteria bacterium]